MHLTLEGGKEEMMVYRFITITSGAQEVRAPGGMGGGLKLPTFMDGERSCIK